MNSFQKVGLGAGIGSLMVVGLGAYLWWSTPPIEVSASSQPRASTHEAQSMAVKKRFDQQDLSDVAAVEISKNHADASPWSPQGAHIQATPALPEVPHPFFGKGGASQSVSERPPTSTDMTLSAIAIGKNGAPSLQMIQQRLHALVANGRQPTPREVDQVLADLQQNQGTNVVSGVDLRVMRDNLAHTHRIAEIAKEIQGIAANPTKDDEPRIAALVAEMQRRQGAMVSPMVAQGQR